MFTNYPDLLIPVFPVEAQQRAIVEERKLEKGKNAKHPLRKEGNENLYATQCRVG